MFNRISPFWILLGTSIAAVVGLGAVMLWKEGGNKEPLVVYCAAALSEPMKEIVPLYEQQTGQKIELRYGKSEELLASIKTTKQGDVYLPADYTYLKKAADDGLIGDTFPIGGMKALVVLNPRAVRTIAVWDDLFQDRDAKIAIGSEGSAIRDLTQKHLPDLQWQRLLKQSTSLGTVTDVANGVKLGTIDCGIIWDNMLTSPNYRELRSVKLKELDEVKAAVKIGVIKSSTNMNEAVNFARFVSGSCGDIFKKHGFTLADDRPASGSKPSNAKLEIVVYAGAMLRPAVEETIKQFAEREKVEIKTVYNGCGILVSQMKVGERPDLYFACDPQFMTQVSDLFEKPKVISKNQLVIAVPKGNPNQIKTLKDLGQPGLKIGVGHEQQCALGAITQGVLIRTKTLKAVTDNIATRAPSGDLLINQLRAVSLDAVVAYVSNVKPYADELDAIRIEEVNCAPAQPIAAGKNTAHPELVKRLIQAIESAESRERFEKLGFGWELAP